MKRREDKAFWKGGGRKDQAKLFSGGRGLVYGSMGGLVLLLSLMLLPITPASSSSLGENETMTVGLNTKTTAYLYSTITLSTSGQVDIDIVPRSTGALGVGTAEVKVATNNTTGYSMFLSTVDGTNRLNQIDSNLQYSGKTQDYYIDTLKQATTADSYLTNTQNLNTWGYALTSEAASGSTEYRGMTSTTGDQIYTTKGTSSNDSYNLNLAVAVDTTLPAGGYRNGLVITAVANPIILSGFNQIYYMQDMTPAVCESAEMESTAQLVDRRDNKLYWVAKLKDGNCWMTQNLGLDIAIDNSGNAAALSKTGEKTALTPENTDLTSPWTINSAFPPTATITNSFESHDSSETKTTSYSIGEYVIATPILHQSCGTIEDYETFIANCTSVGLFDVSSGNWQPFYNSQPLTPNSDGKYIFNNIELTDNTNLVSVQYSDPAHPELGGIYDAHYLAGNYYTFGAATAGEGGALAYGESSTSSICPKGWTLPQTTTDKSLRTLLQKYGLENIITNTIDGTFYQITNRPLYFLSGGSLDEKSYGFSQSGGLWINQASSPSNTGVMRSISLSYNATNVYPSGNTTRANGLNVRCVSK